VTGGLVLDVASLSWRLTLLYELAILKESLIGRIEDELAVVAVEQGVFAGVNLGAHDVQTDHGRGCAGIGP